VRTVEQIVEQIRTASGADFAFVLTRKGRLVTYRAPREMPEEGRGRLVRAARPVLGTEDLVELTLPREDLVPYGGAAPVDVYVGTAAEQAIVCVVMATWADKRRVAAALSAGLRAIEPLLRRGLPAARRSPDLTPAKGSRFTGDRRTLLPSLPPSLLTPSTPPPSFPLPRPESLPEIHVGEARLGHLSLIAVQHDAEGSRSSPDIAFGEGELGRQSLAAVRRDHIAMSSAPEIVVTGEAAMGRETMAAIERDGKPRPTSSPEAIRVELVSFPDDVPAAETTADTRAGSATRLTVPWVELPNDTKRAADAAGVARKLASPKVTLKLEEIDDLEGITPEEPPKSSAAAREPLATLAYPHGSQAAGAKPAKR